MPPRINCSASNNSYQSLSNSPTSSVSSSKQSLPSSASNSPSFSASSSMRSSSSNCSQRTQDIKAYTSDREWSVRQREIKQYHAANNTSSNGEVLKLPFETTRARLEKLQADFATSTDPARIQKLEQRIERLKLRLSQLKWLSNQKKLTVIGFDGWGEGCTAYGDDELSPKKLKPGQVLGEYDSVVCKINDEIKVFRLNGTIPLQEQLKYQDAVPQEFYLHSTQFIEQNKKLKSLVSNALKNNTDTPESTPSANASETDPLIRRSHFFGQSEIEKISGALLKKSGWFRIKKSGLYGIKELWVKGEEKASGAPIDGFDDSAYLASTAVDGLWQPLLYLGVLSFFTPWVVIGEKGLRGEYLENKESRQQLKQELIDIKPELISKLKQALGRDDIDLENSSSKKQHIYALKEIVNSPDRSDKDKEEALTSMLHLQGLMTLEDELNENNLDIKESWLAMRGMQGMLASMVAFSSDAVITFITMLAKPGATSVLQVGSHIGNAGLGVMGVAQFLMMLSGGIKAGRGVKEQHAIKNLIKQIQKSSDKINDKVLASIKNHLKNQSSVIWKKKIWPGASLTLGQALMCTASALALVTLFSGAAFAWYITIPLLAVGVAFTLLSALYLQKKGEAAEEEMFGQDEGFTPKSLLENTIQNLKDSSESTVELLTGIKSKIEEYYLTAEERLNKINESKQKIEALHPSITQRLKSKIGYKKLSDKKPIQFLDIQELYSDLYKQRLNESNKVGSVLNYIRAIGKEDEFVEALFAKRHSVVKIVKKIKDNKNISSSKNLDVFDRKKFTDIKPVESFKMSRPWKLKDTRLMHPSGQIKKTHTLYELNEKVLSEKIKAQGSEENLRLQQQFCEIALETIIDFSKNLERAKQSARRKLLMNMMESDLLTVNRLSDNPSSAHAAHDNAA